MGKTLRYFIPDSVQLSSVENERDEGTDMHMKGLSGENGYVVTTPKERPKKENIFLEGEKRL